MKTKLFSVEGFVVSNIFSNTKNPLQPYHICKIQVISEHEEVTQEKISVTFRTAPPVIGDTLYRFYGQLKVHPVYGETLECETYIRTIPLDVYHVVDFLASGLFKGIGKKRAKNIVRVIGEDCLIKIMEDPTVLNQVKGIPQETVEQIQDIMLENMNMQKIIGKLHEWNITLNAAKKIYKVYGDSSIPRIEKNPYCLASDVDGMSFKTSDELAKRLHFEYDSDTRIRGAIEHVLNTIYDDEGSTWANEEYVINKTARVLVTDEGERVPLYKIKVNLEDLIEQDIDDVEDYESSIGGIGRIGNRIFLARYLGFEQNIAKTLHKLYVRWNQEKFLTDNLDDYIYAFMNTENYFKEQHNNFVFTDEQQKAFLKAFEHSVLALIGGPGTGKSTIIKGILMTFFHMQVEAKEDVPDFFSKVKLLAPTGRAAKRMSELSEIKATTIHQYLLHEEADYEVARRIRELIGSSKEDLDHSWDYNERRSSRIYIIDEMSMVDITLMNRFLKTTRKGDRILLVGDPNQLPSIGAGNVLSDILYSNEIPIVNLTQVHRQQAGSGILLLAELIRKGETAPDQIFFKDDTISWVEAQKDDILPAIRERIVELLKQGVEFNDIQVICPFNRGDQGIKAINAYLQRLMLVDAFELGVDFQETGLSNDFYHFYIGDRIIQLSNNHTKGVSNGDVGVIVKHIPKEESQEEFDIIVVDYNGNYVFYTEKELEEISIAYAFSIHKAQGSEFPYIILPMSPSYSFLMNRNFIYTAITRAKQNISIIGDKNVFLEGINKKPRLRFTFLAALLKAEKNRITYL